MTKLEKKLINVLEKYLDQIFLIGMLVGSCAIRYVKRNYISWDMSSSLLPWYDQIKDLGGYSH